MLDYEWGNPSPITLSGDDSAQDSDQTRQIFDHYTQVFNDTTLLVNPNAFSSSSHNHFQTTAVPHTTSTHNYQTASLYDPRAYGGASFQTPPPSMVSLEGQGGFVVVPKPEPIGGGYEFAAARIGLNLGGRTYFASSEDDFVNRLYRRSRTAEAGSLAGNSPRCQAEGCQADLTHAKHYHRRHKVCEFHSKSATVVAAGLTQRFCQQCSRFHLLSEFDNGKRSCRKRLADHNRRRRKSSQHNNQEPNKQPGNAIPDNNLAKSPQDSGANSSSSVTIAISPPRISLDYFRQAHSFSQMGDN